MAMVIQDGLHIADVETHVRAARAATNNRDMRNELRKARLALEEDMHTSITPHTSFLARSMALKEIHEEIVDIEHQASQ